MTTYEDAGVDVKAGDNASASAYAHAISTFASRKGMIGAPVEEKDGYAGFLDMGDFFLVQSDDSTGTKIDLAFAMQMFDTLGADLVAMVADDAVCTGAEAISISNTLDTPKIEPSTIDSLMGGLAQVCSKQKIVVPAGEIAEVPGAVTHGVWSATIVGIVEKDKVIDTGSIQPGDRIVTIRSNVARSNGFSLIRKILQDAHGDNWHQTEWKGGVSWGEIMLSPSHVYSAAVLELIGRYGQERKINIHGIAHITGGGIPSKLKRVLKKSGYGASLTDLFEPHAALQDLIALGGVATEEAYRTWNMGNGMMLILPESDAATAIQSLEKSGFEAKVCGVVTEESGIEIGAWDGDTVLA